MKEYLAAACKDYRELYDVVRSGFTKERVHLYGPCVGILMGKNNMVDKETFQAKWQFIKKRNTAVYSTVRGAAKIALTAMISDAADPDMRADDFVAALRVLKDDFVNSLFLPIAGMVLAEEAFPAEYERISKTAGDLFDDLSCTRPLCTNEEDVVYCVLLAKRGMERKEFHEEMDRYLKLLSGTFKVNSGVQTAALVLLLSPGEAEEKCKKFCELYDAMKKKGIKFSLDKDLACLAGLVIYPLSAEELAEDLMEVYRYLSGQKEYGLFGCDKRNCIMHATLILEAALRRIEEAKNPAIAQIVAETNAKNKQEKMDRMYEERLAAARASLKAGETLEVAPITEEELEFVENAVYHPNTGDFPGVLAAEQLAIRMAVKNKTGAVAGYATLYEKK